MYQYKHTLTREQIENDLKPDNEGISIIATIMVFVCLLGALVVTGFIYLIAPSAFDVHEDSPGIHIAAAVVWIIAGAMMLLFGSMALKARKPAPPPTFAVVKRRLDTIAREEYQYTSYAGGRAHAVYRDVFYFEGMSKYYPTSTQLELAEEGDMYYVVISGEGSATPLRIYRADAYVWHETPKT